MKTRLLQGMALILMIALMGAFVGTGAFQDVETPSWVIRSDATTSIIDLAIWTNEGEVAQDEVYEEFVSFELDSPAYVYIFNISAADESGAQDINLLLPNINEQDNFFEAGTHSIFEEIIIEDEPEGAAFIQAIASPFPLNVTASDVDTFRFLGNDPDLYFRGVEFELASKGLLQAEWTGDWTTYAVRGGGLEAFAAGARCTKIRINVPVAEGLLINYTVDSNCINGAQLSGSFTGPNSPDIVQVLEGSRTVTVSMPGFQSASQSLFAEFGRRTVFEIVPEQPEPQMNILINPINPSIYDDVTFFADVISPRPISSFTWDFGDDSFSDSDESPGLSVGQTVVHKFIDGTTADAPYKIRMTIIYDDNLEPSTEIVTTSLEVGQDAIPGACPPETVTMTEFAQSLFLESTSIAGCITVDVPQRLIDTSSLTHDGTASILNQFTWEALPLDAKLRAFVFIKYKDSLGGLLGEARPMSLVRTQDGFFTAESALDIPTDGQVNLTLVLNILENPSASRIALDAGPFELSTVTSCTSAKLLVRNEETNSEGDRNSLISFRLGTPVDIVFQNTGCGVVSILESSLLIRNGLGDVKRIGNASITVSAGESATFSWDQTDENGEQVSQGAYTILLDTDQGLYPVDIWVLQ